MFSRSIHVVACIRTSFYSNILSCEYDTFFVFTHLTDIWFGFAFLSTMNNDVNVREQAFACFHFLRYVPKSVIAKLYDSVCPLIFLAQCRTIPVFLHLANTCCLFHFPNGVEYLFTCSLAIYIFSV